MNKTPRLSKSGIEYLDYAWNFYSGCENWEQGICPVGQYCWARKITERFKPHYPNGFEPTFYPEAFLSPLHLKKPSIVGCAFMGDLFGDWVDPNKKFHSTMPSEKASISMSLKGWIFTTIKQCPQHTFLFLTKCAWNLPKWSPFPENCWVGVTATNREMYLKATGADGLDGIEAKVKYISFEPLLEAIHPSEYRLKGIDLVIIGACTGEELEMRALAHQTNREIGYVMPSGNKWTLQPKIEWVQETVRACDKTGVAVFEKDNLMPLMEASFGRENYLSPVLTPDGELRQKMPKGEIRQGERR